MSPRSEEEGGGRVCRVDCWGGGGGDWMVDGKTDDDEEGDSNSA